MDKEVASWVSKFILLGITDKKELQLPLFVLFLLVYIITLVGNLGMIVLIKTDSSLHIPMYFFLSNLAFVDINYSSSITPNMLVSLLTKRKSIGFAACAIQMFVFVICGSTECLLLAVMAFDRYVAICHPLRYSAIMTGKICVWLAGISYFLGIFYAVLHTTLSFSLTFCGSNMINHYYCDILPLIKLSCSDTHINETVLFAQVSINGVSTTVTILFSYASILITILNIRSTQSRRKAFSTCSSHLIVVSLFYGTIFFMYLRPSSSYSLEKDKVASLFYTVIIPMLNPLIYSLRNKEVKEAFWRMFRKTV
ncbi:olfactory receptor 1019-like isoform X1 [Thamnophis elegans]|uniref:olfactory receptor 1019-like isoform X1 n=2 Tax=Thamnophis elegans TaxID=35005 RepID=UPI0013773679|nr:olfactory receptor 1019-like isoform X1 [Thamnophis elegans]